MKESLAGTHLGNLVKTAFPADADVSTKPESGDLCLYIDWRLATDASRPSKRSRQVMVRISREAISDYSNGGEHHRETADRLLLEHLKQRLATFNPEHDSPAYQSPPREVWVISTRMINV